MKHVESKAALKRNITLNEVAKGVSEKLFSQQSTISGLQKKFTPDEFKDLIIAQMDEIQSAMVAGRDDFAKAIQDYLNGKATNYIHYMHDGTSLRVVTPAILILPATFFTSFKAFRPALICTVK